MNIYSLFYTKTRLATGYKVYDVNINVTTEELAIQIFKELAGRIRARHINEALSIHECIGVDPCDFEYHEEFITFELVTEEFKYEINVIDIPVHETLDEVLEHYTIFEQN